MNGLVVYQGNRAAQVLERVSAVQKSLGHGLAALQCGDTLLCRLQLKTWKAVDKGAPYTDKASGISVVVDGYFREGYDGPIAANLSKEAVRLYKKYGKELTAHISGEFNIAVHDTENLHVFNDRFGLRIMYTAQGNGHFIAGTGLRYLTATGLFKKELDRAFALNYLMFNKFRPSQATIYRGMDVYPAASAASVRGGKADFKSYWSMGFTYTGGKKVNVDRLAGIFRRANRRALQAHGKKPVVSLSGGLDSRLMCAAMTTQDAARTGAMTWGRLDSEEVRLAGAVARTAGVHFDAVPVTAPDFVDYAPQGLLINDEIDLFVQGITAKGCAKMPGRYDVVLIGIVFDALLGGSHLDEAVFKLKNRADVVTYIQKKYALVDPKLGVFSRKLYEECYRQVVKRFDEAGDTLGARPAPMIFDSLFLEHAAHRLIFMRYRFYRHFAETATPMYDYELVDAIAAMPLDGRYQHKVLQQLLVKLSPALAKIPYQRTLLPADVPVKYWAKANDIQKQTARLYEQIMCDKEYTGSVEYKRHYSNWEAWARRDARFRAYIAKTVNRKTAAIYRLDLVSPVQLKKRWKEHQAGTANHAQLFLHVVSLNNFIEKYF